MAFSSAKTVRLTTLGHQENKNSRRQIALHLKLFLHFFLDSFLSLVYPLGLV